ncbi:MAG TPA: TonB-dependent receptor [Gemmatimonadales bacterium]|nr:TonB-dependent receptor [Gemmatimonadales bacterium]
MVVGIQLLRVLLAVQAGQATVAGTVRDEETGEPLAGALVALPDLDRSTATDEAGHYLLLDVPPGPQHLTVRFIGYTPRALHALVPSDGRLDINIALHSEPVRLHTIEVRSRVPVRGLEDSEPNESHDRAGSIAAVRNNPLLSEPDVLQALEGGPVVLQPESPSGVHVRGGTSDQTAYLLDGIPVFSPYHAAGQFSAWNPDALSGIQLMASMPGPGYPDALSGTIAATTRAPGEQFGVQGALSTTQARLTLDGQLGRTGAGYLMSLRSRVPGLPAGRHEASYLNGESGDWLAKLELPVLGGRARLLGYQSSNEIDAAAQTDSFGFEPERHSFEWQSGSFGAGWSGDIGGAGVKLLGWSAGGDAAARWGSRAGWVGLSALRRDLGVLASMELPSSDGRTILGMRVERSKTAYRVKSDSASPAFTALTPVVAAFAQHARRIDPGLELTLGASLSNGESRLHFGPTARLRWKSGERFVLAGSYARAHQFAQSLRNAESVVSNVFPPDLFIGAGAAGVPTARSDQGLITAEYRPMAGVRLVAEAYHRATSGLLLVAPREGEPFATGSFEVGSGRSSGLSVEVGMSRARYGLMAGYGLQRVRLTYGGTDYVPDYGTTHLLQSGIIVFPSATTSIRLGATGGLGRRTSTATGTLEWEACNLLDQGCEFGGSPNYTGSALGARSLPAYIRVDLGIRKHWHVRLGDRDAVLAIFATVTNLFDRKNILTYVRDPSTGRLLPIEMRPLAPLVLGLDWRF